MPTSKESPGKRVEANRREFEKGLHEVGTNLPDEIEGVEGADVGRVERHHHEGEEEKPRIEVGHVEDEAGDASGAAKR